MRRRLTPLRLWAGCLLWLLGAPPALAHDFWIEPSSLSPLPGQVVPVRLLVGEHFSGEAVARPAAESLHRFVLVDARGQAEVTLPGRTGSDPAGVFRLARPGSYVIGFHGRPNAIELPARKFNDYLLEEGLESVLALRAARGLLDEPGREIYSRCAKSLIVTPAAGDAAGAVDREIGLALELVAERSPSQLREGQSLPVRLLHEGAPLEGALVVALHRAEPRRRIARRSDADGRVWLPLSRDGDWLVKAVHMRPAAAGSGADWESLWASLRFQR